MNYRIIFFLLIFMITIFVSSCSRHSAGGSAPSTSPKQEAKPDLSEPVPGAEILIEQENNETPQPK